MKKVKKNAKDAKNINEERFLPELFKNFAVQEVENLRFGKIFGYFLEFFMKILKKLNRKVESKSLFLV